jgi:hypothetical protein
MAYINLCHYLIFFNCILDGKEDALQPFIDLLDQEQSKLLETSLTDNQKSQSNSTENDNDNEDNNKDSSDENDDEDPPTKKDKNNEVLDNKPCIQGTVCQRPLEWLQRF